MKKRFFLLLIITIGMGAAARAEINDTTATPCTKVLKAAQKTYEEGRISEVPGMLQECMQTEFAGNREEYMQAIRLTILAYLFQDEEAKAEEYLLMLLHEDPEYKLNPAVDPAEFYQLFKKYRTNPVINIGGLLGLNATTAFLDNDYSVDFNENAKSTFESKILFQLGLSTDILLFKNFQINTGVIMSFKKFGYQKSILDSTFLTSTETNVGLDFPLALKYNIGKGKLKPFIYAGANANLLFSSNASMTRASDVDVDAAAETYANGPSFSMKKYRNLLTYYGLVGAGLRYKVGYGYAVLDIRYLHGFSNGTSAPNRYYTDPNDNKLNDIMYYYGYISPDFYLRNLSVSVGYYKSFYKPKKIKTTIE